jgi:asparagine N-glycosylation enzyme membrane subunit Stt3
LEGAGFLSLAAALLSAGYLWWRPPAPSTGGFLLGLAVVLLLDRTFRRASDR